MLLFPSFLSRLVTDWLTTEIERSCAVSFAKDLETNPGGFFMWSTLGHYALAGLF